MKKANTKFPRRAVLAGLGSGAAATFLRPLDGQAQPPATPQRLLIIHRPGGTVPDQWWPTGGVTNWTASPILNEFAALRNEMVVLSGIDCPRDPNGIGDRPAAGMLAMMTPPPASSVGWPSTTGAPTNDPNTKQITATDESIDQLLLHHVPTLQCAVPSLQLAMSRQASLDSILAISYQKPLDQLLASALKGESDPAVARQTLLGAMPDFAALQALDKKLYDFVGSDITRLRDRAPRWETPKLNAHLEALRQLADLDEASCTLPTLPALPVSAPGMTQDEAQYVQVCKQQSLLIKAAFACDLTRVVTLTFGAGESSLRFKQILPAGAINEGDGFYGLGQNTGAQASLAVIEKFFAATTAALLLDLKNTPDPGGGGSLLDNTLVVYLSECSVANTHGTQNMPVLAFGGKFLGLKGGSFLTFYDRTMSDFWVATANAFGYPLTAFGAPEWNTGALPGLYG
jgi:Protein of unknown function (DUF1552)